MSQNISIRNYKIISYALFAIIALYIVGAQLIIYKGWDKYLGKLSIILFQPKFEIKTDIISLRLNREAQSIQLKFENALNESVTPIEILQNDVIIESSKSMNRDSQPEEEINKNSNADYNVELSNDRYEIRISAKNDKTLLDKPIKIGLYDKDSNRAIQRFIVNILIDNKEHSIQEIFYDYFSKKDNNLILYYLVDLKNTSNFLASEYGIIITRLITAVLLIFFSFQLLYFFISVVWQPSEICQYFANPANYTQNNTVTWVDEISEKFSISLGFLGTVTSIWVALESSESDYSSFYSILEIIKVAIFTTVLGLGIKILCLIRGLLSPIIV